MKVPNGEGHLHRLGEGRKENALWIGSEYGKITFTTGKWKSGMGAGYTKWL